MIVAKLTLLLAAALALGGCDVTSKSGAGEGTSAGAFSANGDRATASAALTNAELGRLIGTKIGSALNDDDRRLAYEAQIKALEAGSPGAPMPWRNPASGRYGN